MPTLSRPPTPLPTSASVCVWTCQLARCVFITAFPFRQMGAPAAAISTSTSVINFERVDNRPHPPNCLILLYEKAPTHLPGRNAGAAMRCLCPRHHKNRHRRYEPRLQGIQQDQGRGG